MQALLNQAARDGYTRGFVDALREGARTDDCDALTILAMFHRDGLRGERGEVLIRKNARLALSYDLRAAELGEPSAMASIADALTSPPSSSSNLARDTLYKRAFRLGNTTAALNLAATYQNLGRYRDAVRWFRRALAAGDPSALLELAKAELLGMGTRRNVPAAFERLRRLARGVAFTAPFERTEAMEIMADAFRNGWLVRRDYPQAIRLLRKAASLGSDAARGLLVDEGFDVS
ncbi:MAG: tetratricopeptide repeat protein [Myxococcota bacterium]|nr:tetratricopeptide repeat protein [Myxococcota bacterium]